MGPLVCLLWACLCCGWPAASTAQDLSRVQRGSYVPSDDVKAEVGSSKASFARRLRGDQRKKLRKGGDKEKWKQLKKELQRSVEEKRVLRNDLKDAQREIDKQAQKIAELTRTSQLSRPVAPKGAGVDAQKAGQMAEQISTQQKDIASLTKELTEFKIKNQDLLAKFDDPALQTFMSLAERADRMYHDPGIEGAVNKSAKLLFPHLVASAQKGTDLYIRMNATLHDKLLDLLGSETPLEPWFPAVTGFLVYGLICFPLGLSLVCLAEFVCNLKYILIACSFYLFTLSCLASAWVTSTNNDPMHQLAEHDASVYLVQQAVFAFVLVAYCLLLTLAICFAEGEILTTSFRTVQLTLICSFCAVYYRLVWTPAMLDEMPRIEAFQLPWMQPNVEGQVAKLPYFVGTIGFLVVFALEEMIWYRARSDKDDKEEKVS